MGAEQGPSFRSKLYRQTKNKTSLQLTAHTSRHSSLLFLAFVIKSGSSRPASRGRQAEPGFRHKAFKKQFSRDWASGPPDCHRSVLFFAFCFFLIFFLKGRQQACVTPQHNKGPSSGLIGSNKCMPSATSRPGPCHKGSINHPNPMKDSGQSAASQKGGSNTGWPRGIQTTQARRRHQTVGSRRCGHNIQYSITSQITSEDSKEDERQTPAALRLNL